MTSRGTLGRGPTLFARCDIDLASSIGPVAITFSPEPFVWPPPGPANIAAASGPELMPPASAPGGGVPGSMTPGRTLSGGPAGPQPDTSSPKPPGVTLPTTNVIEVQVHGSAAASPLEKRPVDLPHLIQALFQGQISTRRHHLRGLVQGVSPTLAQQASKYRCRLLPTTTPL
ncbi:hypothetical protein PTI98_009232 [Pleurotus ostreatus]|nr:hypothetical protein PTI98_009232 [Pleurotus ostreatus]